ncbi:bifunctional glycosyltransferase/CDP-glycerol:glycerophosphate glycerophosphotransferase [Asanoa iriomotensis]|uniref:Glycosyl transferase n=1 Tax=Asanoa iriomotensis TaxID=234613 RepID=A0ABQ4CDA9_9ACTN|nr:bifunctional glycosyltransferase/CDP-glycerol:glycerophosphate glycerophosphotransferase [Asanoa iriomotensis]GIF60752.1 glycosyl transferase [Asanoa iriomotensis]
MARTGGVGSPLISFIVPVYNVRSYLRQCLDSMLADSSVPVELIAVDDRSTDGSAEVLAEYAARDPRVTVLTLDRNGGQGPARNRGLEQATGDYVWFVDSDDWLADGIVPAVAARIADLDPDVVVVDHVRAHWDGRVDPSLNRFARTPEVFALHEWPRAIEILHTPWNKIVRRSLLLGTGFRFRTGWYEDIPFTYRVLMAADRITLLDRVGVHYRQRRVGAATRTVGEGHFAIFTNWSEVFDTFDDGRPGAALLRKLLFRRMIWHFLVVRGNEDRLPDELRARFFGEMTAHYHRYLPAGGYPAPGGMEGVKHRLVAGGRHHTFQALRFGFRRAQEARATGEVAARAGNRGRRVARLGRAAVLRAYYHAELRRPLDPNLALYAAYWYRGYACNPAAIYETAKDLAPGVRGVWVVRRDKVGTLPPGVPYVVAGTRAYFRALAQATYLVNNVNWPNYVVKRPGSTHVMTHHGTPLKVMGIDQQDYPGGVQDPDFAGQLRRADRWDYSVTANAFTTQAWERAYPCRYRTLETGYPRNDRLALATAGEVARVRAELGIEPGQRVVLYAATHREHLPGYHPPFDPERVRAAAGPDAVLLIRSHYFRDRAVAAPAPADLPGVRDVSAHPSVEDLYLAADVLITDYSSVMFDYAVLDRPIVIYAPDWEAYRMIRGVYFDIVAEPPGAVALTLDDLVDTLRTGAFESDAATKARSEFRGRFTTLEDGRAAERVIATVFGD